MGQRLLRLFRRLGLALPKLKKAGLVERLKILMNLKHTIQRS